MTCSNRCTICTYTSARIYSTTTRSLFPTAMYSRRSVTTLQHICTRYYSQCNLSESRL